MNRDVKVEEWIKDKPEGFWLFTNEQLVILYYDEMCAIDVHEMSLWEWSIRVKNDMLPGFRDIYNEIKFQRIAYECREFIEPRR